MGEQKCLWDGRPQQGDSKDEHGGAEVDGVEVRHADHQAVEGVDLLGVAGEDQDKDDVANDANYGNNHQKNSFNIKFKCFWEFRVIFFSMIHDS